MLLSAPPRSLVKACRRLNPAIDLEVDVVAVTAAAGATTQEEWGDATLTDTTADAAGAVRLSEQSGSPLTLFSSGNSTDATEVVPLANSTLGLADPFTEVVWLDFWPDPAVVGPHGFTLHSLTLKLGRLVIAGAKDGFRFYVTQFDENWNRETLTQIDIPVDALGGGTWTAVCVIDFRAGTINGISAFEPRRIRVHTGRMRTRTGAGRDGAGAVRETDVVLEGDRRVSHLSVPKGFSIGVTAWGHAHGRGQSRVYAMPHASQARFDIASFWRAGGDQSCGPYSPDAGGAPASDPERNPGYGFLETGAVPGYGAVDTPTVNGSGTPFGQWGIARQVSGQHYPQRGGGTSYWERPYHTVKAVTFEPTGTVVRSFDLGATPTGEVHFRADAAEPTGTSVAFSLERSADGSAWTSIGAVADGEVLTGVNLARHYRVTATLTASADGLATPELHAIFFTERTRYATYKYLGRDVDSMVTVDPVTGQSEIGELEDDGDTVALSDGTHARVTALVATLVRDERKRHPVRAYVTSGATAEERWLKLTWVGREVVYRWSDGAPRMCAISVEARCA